MNYPIAGKKKCPNTLIDPEHGWDVCPDYCPQYGLSQCLFYTDKQLVFFENIMEEAKKHKET